MRRTKLDDDDLDLIDIGYELETMSKKMCAKSNVFNNPYVTRKLLSRQNGVLNNSANLNDDDDDNNDEDEDSKVNY